MKLLMFAAVILFCLYPAFAGDKGTRVYTNQDLKKYETDAGEGSGSAVFRQAGFSKCYEVDLMSEAQLRSFLGELDSMQEHYMSKSVPDEEKQGILKSIRACRGKVEAKLKSRKRNNSQQVENLR